MNFINWERKGNFKQEAIMSCIKPVIKSKKLKDIVQ